MKIISSISIIALTFMSHGLLANDLAEKELLLDSLLTHLRASEDNNQKKERNATFKAELAEFVKSQDALTYKFTKLKTVGIIDSPDNLVRIINWNVEQDDLSHKYYCFVLRYIKKKKRYYVSEMNDVSFGMPSMPTDMVTQDNWYGALYYKIIPIRKGSRDMYTLIGWDYNSSLSQVKLLDVMYFSGSNVKFGSPVFKVGKETKYRIFFEHSKKATMYMNYEADRKRIMMDHLSPESPALKNFRSFYVPDLSYDAMVFESNKWVLKEDVIGVNSSEGEEKTIYTENPKTGLLEAKTVDNKWENPENPEAPAGGNTHIAVVPEGEVENPVKKKKTEPSELDKRIDKKDKRKIEDYSSFDPNSRKAKRLKRKRLRKQKRLLR